MGVSNIGIFMWNWLFNRNKKHSDLEDKINELKIGFLTIILSNLEHSDKSDCKSIIAKVEQIKSDLECASIIDLTEVINLFSPPSVLKILPSQIIGKINIYI